VSKLERAKRFEAKVSDFNGLQDFGRLVKNSGQPSSQHGQMDDVADSDDVDVQTNFVDHATGENHLRNPKIAQVLHKNNTSACAECPAGAESPSMHPDLIELAALWPRLDTDIRYSIMTIVRRTAVE
jgi:hypothetical protein